MPRPEQCQKCEPGSKVRGERRLTEKKNLLKGITSPQAQQSQRSGKAGASQQMLAFLKTKDKATNAAREKYGSFQEAKQDRPCLGQFRVVGIEASPRAERPRETMLPQGSGAVAQLVFTGPWSPSLAPQRLGLTVYVYTLSAGQREAGGSEVPRRFEISMGYMLRPCPNTTIINTTNGQLCTERTTRKEGPL